ncbi:MAG TPA: Ig-like domain-containing protein [Gemmatimonadales bacterium]|nr:Ig-like domain-containing protein [Gemmatimonadales bacterium]
MPHGFKLSHRLSRYRLVGILSILAVAACSSTDSAVTSPDTTQDSARNARTVIVTPSALSGTVGQTGQLTAVVKNGYGQVMAGAIVTWTSNDTAVVKVNGSGLATGVGAGSATVTATSAGARGTASITVSSGTTATAPASVSDLATSAATDSSVALTFTEVNDGTGAPASYEIRLAPGSISWGTAAPAVSGTCGTPLAGTSVGNRRTCTVGGLTAGTSYQFQIVAFRGTLNQNAVFGALSNVATAATLAQMVVGAVVVSPTAISGSIGQTGQFTAAVTDPSGAPLSGQKVSWASSSNSVVTIDSTGMAKAMGAGSATITAACGGKSGTAAVTVSAGSTPGAPATITISPATASVQVGATQLFTASVKDGSGNVLTGETVTFSSSNLLVGTIGNLSGIVTALAAGTSTITATDGALHATATLTVTATQPPPPPSGGGSWPNQPSSYPLITDEPFNALNENGWASIWNTSGYGTEAQDPTAPYSPSGVFQVMFPNGFQSGSAPATEITSLPGLKRVYVGMWWKVSNPWQGNPTNVNKIQYLFTNSMGSMFMCMYGSPGGPYELRVFPQFSVSQDKWLTPNVNNVPVTMGVWHRLEWVVDYSGSTSRIQWWMDGTLIGDYSGVPMPSESLIEYHLDPVWGGTMGTKSETDYYWYDHVRISGN